MREIKRYIQKKKKIFIFIGLLWIIGAIVGLIISLTNIEQTTVSFTTYQTEFFNIQYNQILLHFFLLVSSLFLSFYGIGIPILCAIIFYEAMSFGFLISGFLLTFQLKGLLFSIPFIIIVKFFYWLFLLLLFLQCIEITRKRIGKYLYKIDPSHIIKKKLTASILAIIFTLTSDIILYFLGTPILSIFHFLLT